MVFNFLDPVFGPLLYLPTFFAVLILSVFVSLVITLITKFTTNQALMKQLKTELKDMQKKIKTLRDKPDEMMKLNKKMMEINGKYMKESFKSMLFTFIPIIIIFGWMSANLAYEPLAPGSDFNVKAFFQKGVNGTMELKESPGIILKSPSMQDISSGTASWTLSGGEGSYELEFIKDGKSYFKDILITSRNRYTEPVKAVNDGTVQRIEIGYTKRIVMNLFGIENGQWYQGTFGWLGSYIIISILASILMRKLLDVY